MTDQESSQFELDDLRRRWLDSPTPQLSIQLAEEYRRRDRREQAVEVLEEALQKNPEHLGARVALGRYRVEMGELVEASRELEVVVSKDPTNLVANKLLVNLHLELGRPQKARDRLDLYTLLNAGDPEIEVLEERFAEPGDSPGEVHFEERRVEEPALEHPVVVEEAVEEADLEEQAVLEEQTVREESGLETAPEPPTPEESVLAPEIRKDDLFSLGEPPPPPEFPPAEPTMVAEAIVDDESGPFPELFSGLGEADLWALTEESAVFELGPPARDTSISAVTEPIATTTLEQTLTDTAAVETPAAEEPPAEGVERTATLGSLYLEQGHLEEAEATFRTILDRDPDSADARRGLARVESRRRGWLTAEELLAAEEGPEDETPEKRRARLLGSYLGRLRSRTERT